jgi:hypothetical protein
MLRADIRRDERDARHDAGDDGDGFHVQHDSTYESQMAGWHFHCTVVDRLAGDNRQVVRGQVIGVAAAMVVALLSASLSAQTAADGRVEYEAALSYNARSPRTSRAGPPMRSGA